MALVEATLFGTVDKVALAVQRLQEFEPKEGYYVAFSGGKDSCVLLDLVKLACVGYDAHYNVTTVDPPELVRFIREYHPDVERHQPRETMWQLIVKNGMPPLRNMRYCCRELKEVGGAGRLVVTGIRWQESRYRKKRRLMERCSLGKGRLLLHPIIDWSEADIWQYIKERGLPYCSLYDEGWKRIGCIMCPNGGRKKMQKEAERWPRFAQAYRLGLPQGRGKGPSRRQKRRLGGWRRALRMVAHRQATRAAWQTHQHRSRRVVSFLHRRWWIAYVRIVAC